MACFDVQESGRSTIDLLHVFVQKNLHLPLPCGCYNGHPTRNCLPQKTSGHRRKHTALYGCRRDQREEHPMTQNRLHYTVLRDRKPIRNLFRKLLVPQSQTVRPFPSQGRDCSPLALRVRKKAQGHELQFHRDAQVIDDLCNHTPHKCATRSSRFQVKVKGHRSRM